MTDVTVNMYAGTSREETVVLSQNAASVLMALSELYTKDLISGDEDVKAYWGDDMEATIETPAAITFKGRCVAVALQEANDAQPTSE